MLRNQVPIGCPSTSSRRNLQPAARSHALPSRPARVTRGITIAKPHIALRGRQHQQRRDGVVAHGVLESLTSWLKPKPAQQGASKPGTQKSVFVAGSTGRVGARVVRELLSQGYSVRAGCRKLETAEEAVAVAESYGLVTPDMKRRLELVPFDLADKDSIREAIGGAKSVVCAVGAPESDALNPVAPKAIDGDGTINLIKEASAAGVERFVLITSLGTGKVGWPASILNLFWGVLLWKREAEKALEASGMAFTILRPGGMERPKDDYKETHNLKLSPKDTTFGGQVSRLQVAELVRAVLDYPELAENKILEVTAETTAPRLSLKELLEASAAGIQPDVSPEQQRAAREANKDAQAVLAAGDKRLAAAKADLDAAVDRIQAANASLAEAKDREAEVKAKAAPTLKEGAGVEAALKKARSELEAATQAETLSKLVLEEARKVAASQNNQPLSAQQLKAVRESAASQLRAAAAKTAAPPKEAAPQPAGIPFITPPQPKAAPKAAPKEAPAPAPAAKAAPKEAPAAALKAPEPKKQPNFLAKLFGGGETIEVDVGTDSDSQRIRVPQKGEEEGAAPPAPEAAPKAAPAAAKAAPKEAPAAAKAAPKEAPAAPKEAPAAAPAAKAAPPQPKAQEPAAPPPPPKPTVPVESPEEVEARVLAQIAEERRQKAVADAKARLEREAKAIEALKKANEKAGLTPPPPPPPPAKKAAPPAAKAAPKKEAAPAAPKAAPKAAAGPIPPNKAEAQRWIANWQQRQKAGAGAAAPSDNGKPAAPPAGPAPSAAPPSGQALQNKKEAQQWIANYMARVGKAQGSSAPASSSGNGAGGSSGAVPPNKKEAQEWIARWQAKQKAGQ